MARLRIERAGPLMTLQDLGRFGYLAQGVSASGPMDRGAFERAGLRAGSIDDCGIELTRAGADFLVMEGPLRVGWDGGRFNVSLNGRVLDWPGNVMLTAGDQLSITPGPSGNYGYLQFGARLELAPVLGSIATSTRARLGGFEGKALAAGDVLVFDGEGKAPLKPPEKAGVTGPIRFVWGVHAERFSAEVRSGFVSGEFTVTTAMDRMGVRLADRSGVFAGASILSLVSEPVMPGDIQILGDGTPIVLMRDHQPTGGYPRIGTVITADFDRFAQLRSGANVVFQPVTVEHALALLRGRA